MATKLGLYELVAPQFLAGLTDYLDEYLSVLSVEELHTAVDDNAIVYTGVAQVTGKDLTIKFPGGATFNPLEAELRFRMVVPRLGDAAIVAVGDGLFAAGNGMAGVPDPDIAADGRTLENLNTLLDSLGPAAPAPPANLSDAPTMAFRLELMLANVAFHLGDSWRPGKYENHQIVFDSSNPSKDVRVVLPRVTVEYQQNAGLTAPNLRLKSWGGDFDATDVAAGELIRMEPAIAMHESGRFAFGIGQVVLDLSQNSTPPEIMQFFGIDESWTGLYIKSIRVFYGDKQKDTAITVGVNDALISFTGQVSFEGFVDALFDYTTFDVDVLLFDGGQQIDYQPGETTDDPNKPAKLGQAVIPDNACLQLGFNGGVPAYQVTIDYAGNNLPWNTVTRQLFFDDPTLPQPLPKSGHLTVTVKDSSSPQKYFQQKTQLLLKPHSVQTVPGVTNLATAQWTQNPSNTPAAVVLLPAKPGSTQETLQIVNVPVQNATVTIVDNHTNATIASAQPVQNNQVTVNVPSDSSYTVTFQLAAAQSAQHEYFDLLFDYERPRPEHMPGVVDDYAADFVNSPPARVDAAFLGSHLPAPAGQLPPASAPANSGSGAALNGAEALYAWLKHRVAPGAGGTKYVEINAYASYEGHKDKEPYNKALSERRRQVAKRLVNEFNSKYAGGQPVAISNDVDAASFGQTAAAQGKNLHSASNLTDATPYPPGANGSERIGKAADRVATFLADVQTASAATVGGTLSRGPASSSVIVLPPVPPPFPPANKAPDVLQRLSLRVRVERNVLVLAELSGELDFETKMEEEMRQKGQMPANQNLQGDGVVEFTLAITYDTATRFLTESLSLHAGASDADGLYQLKNDDGQNKPINVLGAMMVLSPILSQVVGNADSPGDLALMGVVGWAVPAFVGGAGFMIAKKLTLYGGELKSRQYLPPQGNVQLSDVGFLFDYGVEFEIHIDALDVHSTKPLRVRYRSVGFNIHASLGPNDPPAYQPLFDPSKGYDIDLNDPGLFKVGGLMGDLLQILGARIARYNPVTVEVELGIGVDLGVVTVDRFQVKWPIEPLGIPSILPSGVKVNIPSTLKGDGWVHIIESASDSGKSEITGFEGGLDITLIPVKVRVAAELAVRQIKDANNHTETAVFASLLVEFPAPIVLGATGLGIFGFQGIFAMHYRRIEEPRVDGDPIGPALKWLIKADGDPRHLKAKNNDYLWEPEIGRWSFGVGMILGSLDGGFLDNLRGLVMLELPGPRLLICVKMQIITEIPGLSDDASQMTVGLLGVLDLDFNLGQITLGVIVDFDIEELVKIVLPIELFFSWNEPDNWHLYIGTLKVPASAEIIGICHGGAYFMIDGAGIKDFPFGDEKKNLPGIAVAAGVYASMVWGSTDVDVYLEVYARADVGVAFEPFFLVGSLQLHGELHVWVVTIEVKAGLELQAEPAWFHGEVCAKVDCGLFEFEGCVDVTFGDKKPDTGGFPELLEGLYLQSFAPVVTAGQAGERPIDGSLGNAVRVDLEQVMGGLTPEALVDWDKAPVVPIDTIPVLQLAASPLVGAKKETWYEELHDSNYQKKATETYTEPLKIAAGLNANGSPDSEKGDGYLQLGATECRYRLLSLSLAKRGPNAKDFKPVVFDAGKHPPAVWRKEKNAGNDKPSKRIELAIGSRTPSPTPRALERSSELETLITETWKSTCTPVAPPVCAFWTFCGEPLGRSAHGKGWELDGVVPPDPPGTIRETPPSLDLKIGKPGLSSDELLVMELAQAAGDPYLVPAEIIGQWTANSPNPSPTEPRVACRRALHLPKLFQHSSAWPANVPKPPAYQDLVKDLQQRLWVNLHVGRANQVTIFLLAMRYWEGGLFEIRQLDSQNKVLKTTPLQQTGPKLVNALGHLPPHWVNPALPLAKDAVAVFDFFATGKPEFKDMQRLLITLRRTDLHPNCVSIQIRALPLPILMQHEYTLLVGAVEVCSQQEQWRYEFESEKKVSVQETLNEYLNDEKGEGVTLLEPGCAYRLQVDYEVRTAVVIDVGYGAPVFTVQSNPENKTRYFYFQTAAETPARMDAWVLGSEPEQQAQHHYYGDPLVIALNDVSTLPMLAAYNAKLNYELHPADLVPADENQEPDFSLYEVPSDVVAVQSKDAPYVSPYYDTLVDKLADGVYPCINAQGSAQHHYITITGPFKPLMDYTLDVKPAASDPNLPMKIEVDPKRKGELPFFRRLFRTSRYDNVKAQGDDIRGTKITHKLLKKNVILAGSATQSFTDQEIADALLAAGEEAVPAPRRNRATIYWLNDPNNQSHPFRQHAVLLDTLEPVWRKRMEPELIDVEDPDGYVFDSHFKHVVLTAKKSLQIVDSPFVKRYAYSTGGARTLVFLDPVKLPVGNQPVSCKLQLRQLASDLYDLPETTADLLEIILAPHAPWEDANDYL